MARICKIATTMAALLLLAACGGGADDYPALLPTEVLLAPPALPAHAAGAVSSVGGVESGLIADRRRLQDRADRAVRQDWSSSDLDARARALRERAHRLSATSVGAE